ncbi:helix-turn-helix domain-containing protein [Nocardia sp. CA-128927]|uniref:helix-turn-helix domain-containing protein n=1 Tax=Nocardia sp. CA-128927 TaxID=3239975 RepID=UPI003D97D478
MTDDESKETGSTLPRRQLGRFLKDAREGTGLSQERAAELMEWGKATYQRLEKGTSERVRVRDVLALCEIFGLDDEKTAIAKGLAEQTPAKSWWHAYGDLIPATFNLYVGLEAGAKQLRFWQPLIVPGLLQTADYSRVLDRQFFPDDTESELDRRVELRAQRQAILTRSRQPVTVSVVVHESAVRTVVGDQGVMAAQLRHLADLSTHDNIDIRILPFWAGFPYGSGLPPFVILDFGLDARGKESDPAVVFAENVLGGMYFERAPDVRRYREAYETLHAASPDPRPSRDILRAIAKGA